MSRTAAAALAALALLAAGEARAHARSTSTSAWDFEERGEGEPAEARVVARLPWSALQTALPEIGGATPVLLRARPDLARLVDDYFTERVSLRAAGVTCPVDGAVREVASPDVTHVGRAWRVHCLAPGPPELFIDPFAEVQSSHIHLARVRLPGGDVVERVFTLDEPRFSPTGPASGEGAASGPAAASNFTDFVALGVEHIATGFDHLAFVLALLLLGSSLREVVTVVTGFTVAHSVTLALGVLGVVRPLPAAVESLIGFSVAVVALENFALTTGPATRRGIRIALGAAVALVALGALAGAVGIPAVALVGIGLFSVAYLLLLEHVERPRRMRWCVAFCFGLVHGFGFAGLLTEIGLPPDRLAPALLGFNVGVELGQLAIVAVAWPLLRRLLDRNPAREPLLVQAASTPILSVGLFWFLSRALG